MAQNLTLQVREIASVTKAVANGDLTKTVDIGAQGEIRELKTTVNSMVSCSFFLLRVCALNGTMLSAGRSTPPLRFRSDSSRTRGRYGRSARRNGKRRGRTG